MEEKEQLEKKQTELKSDFSSPNWDEALRKYREKTKEYYRQWSEWVDKKNKEKLEKQCQEK